VNVTSFARMTVWRSRQPSGPISKANKQNVEFQDHAETVPI
jgi:hypothetical protein